MKCVLVLFSLICGFSSLLAQKASTVQNRFLFVVEKSAAMDRFSVATEKTLAQLIQFGVQGQMRSGDTFGLWTYNEKLNTELPMQHWNTETRLRLTAMTLAHFKKQRYEKKGDVQAMLPALHSVIQSSKAITVVLISAGREPIQGTPFDQNISDLYADYRDELREAKLPFVTVLVGRLGKVVEYSVNSSLGPIRIPQPSLPLNPELKDNSTNELVATPKRIDPPKPRIAKENIIISKSKTEPPPPPTPSVETATNSPVLTPKSGEQAIETNSQPLDERASIHNALVVVPKAEDVSDHATDKVKAIADSPAPSPSIPESHLQPSNSLTSKNSGREILADAGTSSVSNVTTNVSRDENRDPTAVGDDVVAPTNSQREKPQEIMATTTASKSRLLIIASGLLGVSVVLLFLILRATRRKTGPSSISRSMDQWPK